jgi:hypothetical protein
MTLSTAMATEKTAEGIRKFAADIAKLEKFVASKINSRSASLDDALTRSQDSPIVPHAHGAKTHVEVGEADPE